MSLHGGNPWAAYQGFTKDKSVKKTTLADGTIQRVLTYATEFRGYIAAYLSLLVIDSLLHSDSGRSTWLIESSDAVNHW